MEKEKANWVSYGLDEQREMMEQDGTEYILGASSPKCITDGMYQLPFEEQKTYYPEGEVQRSDIEDMQDCVARAFTNEAEKKLNWYVYNGMDALDLNFLIKEGYTTEVGGKVRIRLSDAFPAILSNTTRTGNSMKAPAHAVHKYGMVPKSLMPLVGDMTWEDYHNPARITDEIKELGEEFKKRFPMDYDKVYDLSVKESIVVGGYAWPHTKDGVYQRTENRANHCYVRAWPEHEAFDNYIDSVDGDFFKKLAPDYKFLPYAYRLIMSKGGSEKTHPFGAIGQIWRYIFRR